MINIGCKRVSSLGHSQPTNGIETVSRGTEAGGSAGGGGGARYRGGGGGGVSHKAGGVGGVPAARRVMTRRQHGHRNTLLSILTLALCGLILMGTLVGGVAGQSRERGQIGVGEVPRAVVCPPPNEITPCTCRVITKGKDPGLDIVCDHADQKHITNAMSVLKKRPFTIYWMKFRNCNLPRLPDYLFLGMDVRHLHIIRSNVSHIDRSSLSALGGNLKALDLANNQIRRVPTEALAALKELTFLNLNYNKIELIGSSAFQGMDVLERLSLYENQIDHIDENAFKGIGRKLNRLNLGKNKLDKIPTDTFHPLVNLEVLDLHENTIRHINDGAFEGLHKLDMLKLEHNLISTIQADVFKDLTVLNSLNLEHNHITNLSDYSFRGMENNLEWLELGHNRLDHIPSHALSQLHNLRQLDLDSNKIGVVAEDAFRGFGDTIKYILLEKNHIQVIPELAFIDLHSLEWLKLSHNDLKKLTEDTVQPILDTLTHIDISNNPLICNCDLLWLRQWLANPNNADNVESIDEHRCTSSDGKAHAIKNLPFEEFNCPRNVAINQLTEYGRKSSSTSSAALPRYSVLLHIASFVAYVIKSFSW